jgi:histidinol-phosphate aminotransferase
MSTVPEKRSNKLFPKKHLEAIERSPVDLTPRHEYIRLDKNEWTLDYPAGIISKIQKSITPEFLSCYPEVYQLYDALSQFHSLPAEQFLITAGSDGAIRATYDAFVSPGDEIINILPNFAMYSVYSKLYRAKEIGIYYHEKDLSLDIPSVLKKINKKTRFVIISNPNSPAGVLVPNEDIEKLIRATAGFGGGVLIDEAYYPISGSTALPFINEYENLIILRSFSKAFGLASARVGYAISNAKTIGMLAKYKPMYETNSLGILCATTLLENYPVVEKTVRNLIKTRTHFVRNLEELGMVVLPSQTNFVNIVVGHENVSPLLRLFETKGILIRPGYNWGILGECIRVSIGNPESMDRVVEILRNWKKRQG